MEKKLRWNAIGFERKTKLLLENLKTNKESFPTSHTKERRKLESFSEELENIRGKTERINQELIPNLERILRLKFPTPELILISLSRPSVRTIYEQINEHFQKYPPNPLKSEEYSELASSGDAANVLALIGDAVLDLAVVQSLWDSSLATAGDLSDKRIELVSSMNLAKVCDEWELCSYRLERLHQPTKQFSKTEKIEHEKATLVESIYGIIYLEFGFEEIIRTVPLIKYP